MKPLVHSEGLPNLGIDRTLKQLRCACCLSAGHAGRWAFAEYQLKEEEEEDAIMQERLIALTFALLLPLSTHGQGIPGLRGPDHFGLTVPDQQQALTFFTEVIGCKAYYTIGPFKFDNEWMKDNLNVDSRTELRKATMLRCAYGTNIELLDYRPPERNDTQPRNSDIGGHHIGFLVDDIASATAYLRSKGVQVLGEPKTVTRGPTAGKTWVYFLAPWGTQLEIAQYPNGLAYEKEIDGAGLWNPARPAE